MKTAYINGREIADKQELHRVLAEQLEFPPYYGGNLDALYDLLSTAGEPCCGCWRMPPWKTVR